MDVGSIESRITKPVGSSTVPAILSDDDRRALEQKYSDLLLDHSRTTPSSSERRKLRKEINDLAERLGKSKERVRGDVKCYEAATTGTRVIRQSLSDFGVYSPYHR